MLEKTKVPALQRAMQILDLLADRGTCQPAEIVEQLGIPKSSAYLLFEELKRYRLITQDQNGGLSLGLKLIALGERAAARLDVREVAREHLMRLMEETGLLCHFGFMDGNAAYYILKIESNSTISVRSYVGKRLSLSSSGIGKCLLAWQPESVRRNVIAETVFHPTTPTTITSPQALEAELEKIRAQGWGFDNGEDVPDVRCVAAPVFDAKNVISGAISVVGAAMQIKDARVPDLAVQVMACAHAISKDLGWNKTLA